MSNYDDMHFYYYPGTASMKKMACTLGGFYHNDTGPAVTLFYESGVIKCKYYYINGRLHRKGKNPAIIEYYESGIVKEMRYFKYGNMRSVNSKHRIRYAEDGKEIELN